MKSSRNRQPIPVRKKNLPLAWVILADLLLIGAGLLVFALFHHVLPRDIKTSGESLPRPSTTAASTVLTDSSQTDPASSGETTSAENTAATTASGSWGAKFAGKFTDGSVEKTSASYKSANINIQINKVQAGKVTYYVADIYLRDLDYFRTAFAGGSYAHGRTATVPVMAAANKAILAINGDYYGIRDLGVVIRNGELYRETVFKDVLLMNYDGSMQTFTADAFKVGQAKANGAWQAWSFGPMLLDGGQPMTKFNSDVPSLNPRSAIGYFEPGHYCFVLVDGRQDGYSIGMTLTQLSQAFYDLGCKAAYNLDGGQSSVMTFMGGLANQPYRGGRQSSDIIYIAELG
jgi:exopolysaccharide biosynthesis protein